MIQILGQIQNAILNLDNIESCLIYPTSRTEITAPAVFLEIASFSPGRDPATGELSLVANIEARVVVDSSIENAETVCQELACQIAYLAHLNSFGCNIFPGQLMGISRDSFRPEFDQYICWLVEWNHEIHMGKSVWNEIGVQPHVLHINNEVTHD